MRNLMGQSLTASPVTGLANAVDRTVTPRVVGVTESIRRTIDDPETLTDSVGTLSAQDGIVAKWFSAALDVWGKRGAYAAAIGVSESYLSRMCSGDKPIALRHLIPLAQCARAVQAFVAPLCRAAGLEPPQPRRRLSRDDVAELAMRLITENPSLLRLICEEGAVTFACEPEDVAHAMRHVQ